MIENNKLSNSLDIVQRHIKEVEKELEDTRKDINSIVLSKVADKEEQLVVLLEEKEKLEHELAKCQDELSTV